MSKKGMLVAAVVCAGLVACANGRAEAQSSCTGPGWITIGPNGTVVACRRPGYDDYFDKGFGNYAAGRYALAIDNFSRAIELWPDYAAAYQLRCAAREALGQDPDAVLADCNKAVKITPTNLDGLLTRAHAETSVGHYLEAIADIENVLRVDPYNALAQVNKCRAFAYWGQDVTSALMLCSNFAMMHNGSVEALESLAVVHYRMKSYADAVADANEALRIEPKGASALYLRGLAKLRQGDPAAAKLDFAASQAFDTRIAEKFAIHGLTP